MSGARPTLEVHNENLRLKEPFAISGYTFSESPITVVTLRDGDCEGRGEAAGVYYLKDTTEKILTTIEAHRDLIESGLTREELREALPAGGARNAIDCALWDLEACRTGKPAWQLAGIEKPRPLLTTFTVSAKPPNEMAKGARDYTKARAIKIKLTGEVDLDIERIRAVRAARPDVWLGVDANQGYVARDARKVAPGSRRDARFFARATLSARAGKRSRRHRSHDPDRRR